MAAAQWLRRHTNVQGTDPWHQVHAHIQRCLGGRASIVAFNELKPKRVQDYVRTGLPAPWRAVVRGELGIAWRDDVWDHLDTTYERVHGGVLGITPTRGILSVLLRHRKTRRLHWDQVTHAGHHLETGGLARRAVGWVAGQLGRARKHFAMLAASIVAHQAGGTVTGRRVQAADVFGSGDLNVDYKAEKRRKPAQRTSWFPLTVIGRVAKPVMPQGGHGTHGRRAIDWGWRRGPDLVVTRCRVRGEGTSDHNPVDYTTVQE